MSFQYMLPPTADAVRLDDRLPRRPDEDDEPDEDEDALDNVGGEPGGELPVPDPRVAGFNSESEIFSNFACGYDDGG